MARARKTALWRFRFCAFLGSFLLIFLIGEAAVRIFLHSRVASPPAPKVTQAPAPKPAKVPVAKKAPAPPPREPLDPSLPVFKGMLDLGRKNVRGIHKRVLFRTNSQRLRGPEYRRFPGKDVFRIAITGDSVTMGEGVEEAMTYSARLAEMLDLPGSDDRIEVLNVGLSGSNAPFAVGRLEQVVRFYHPDLIVYGFTINDIEGPHYQKPTVGTEDLKEVQANPWFAESPSWLVRVVWWVWSTSRIQDLGARNWYAQELYLNYFDNPPALEDWKGALKKFAELAESRGICSLVLIHTHLNQLTDEHPYVPIYDLVEREAEALGLPVTPTFEEFFKGRAAQELWVGFFDPHPNVEGHEILARALAGGLAQLPADCFKRARNSR